MAIRILSTESVDGSATFAGAVTIANISGSQTSPETQLLFDNNNIDDSGGYNIDFKSSSNDTANRYMSRIQALRTTSAKSSLGFFTESGSALTRALLLDDSQNATFEGNVGIGITPNASYSGVDVLQLGKGMTLMGNTNDDRAAMMANLYLDSNTAFRYVMDGLAGKVAIEDGIITFGTAPSGTAGAVATVTERMRITSGGDTQLSGNNLDIKGVSAGNTQIRITDSTGTTGTNSFDLINDGTAAYVWNRKQTDLNFATYGTLRMKIRASGTVGIGANGGYDSQMLSIDAGVLDGAIYATSTDANCFASFRDGNSTANIGFGAIGNAHVFRKDASEDMRIDGNGNVGIGTTSPGRGLSIDKSNQYAALEIIKNNTTNQIVYLGTGSSAGTDDPILQMKHNGTENIRLYATGNSWINGGNVGIGTTSAGTKLDVRGTGNFLGTAVSGAALVTIENNSGSTATSYGLLVKGGGNSSSGKTFEVRDDSGNTDLIVKGNGNVGIGTDSPGAQLHNYSTAATNVFITGHGTAAQNDWGAQNCMFVKTDNGLLISKANAANNTNRIFNFYNDGNGYAQLYMHAGATANVKIQASGNSYFNGGNVGIGTTSPQKNLQIFQAEGGVGVKHATIRLGGYSTVGPDIAAYRVTGNSNDQGLIFSTYDATAGTVDTMTLTNDGNVGIGTISPSNKLDVQITTSNRTTLEPVLSVSASGNGPYTGFGPKISFDSNIYYGAATGNPAGIIETAYIGAVMGTTYATNSDLVFATRDGATSVTEKMRILGNGNVGIGNDNPQQKLDTPNIVIGGASISASYRANSTMMDNLGGVARFYSLGADNSTAGSYQFNCLSANASAGAGTVMTIAPTGNVGIGNISPQTTLHTGPTTTVTNAFTARFAASNFFASGGNSMFYVPDTSANIMMFGSNQFGTNQIEFYHKNPGTSQAYVGRISTSGSATSYVTSSDYRLKENIVPISESISRLNQLKPSRFNFIEEPGKVVDGFIAHEVQDIVPEAIVGEKDEVDEEGGIIPQGIDQAKLVPLLVAAVQELEARVKELENK